MSHSETPVRTTGIVDKMLSESVCLVRLPNDKICLGHMARGSKDHHAFLKMGARVRLELTPFDFSKARITGAAEPIQEDP